MRKKITAFFVFIIFLLGASLFKCDHLLAQGIMTQEESACHLLDQGEIERAIEVLQKALQANPDNLNAQLYLGIALYMKRDLDVAFEKFEKIEKETERKVDFDRPPGFERPEEVDPKLIESWIDRKRQGRILFSEERKGLLYFYRGMTLKEKKDLKNAENRFKEAQKLNYDEKAIALQLIDLYVQKKDFKAASEQLSDIKKISGESELFTFLDGYLEYRVGSIKEALVAFKKLAQTNLTAKKNVALLQYNNEDYQKAIEIWEEILAEYPEDKEAQVNLGRALFHAGETEKAQDYFTKAGMKLSPERFSPKRIPLNYESLMVDVKYDLMCRLK